LNDSANPSEKKKDIKNTNPIIENSIPNSSSENMFPYSILSAYAKNSDRYDSVDIAIRFFCMLGSFDVLFFV